MINLDSGKVRIFSAGGKENDHSIGDQASPRIGMVTRKNKKTAKKNQFRKRGKQMKSMPGEGASGLKPTFSDAWVGLGTYTGGKGGRGQNGKTLTKRWVGTATPNPRGGGGNNFTYA